MAFIPRWIWITCFTFFPLPMGIFHYTGGKTLSSLGRRTDIPDLRDPNHRNCYIKKTKVIWCNIAKWIVCFKISPTKHSCFPLLNLYVKFCMSLPWTLRNCYFYSSYTSCISNTGLWVVKNVLFKYLFSTNIKNEKCFPWVFVAKMSWELSSKKVESRLYLFFKHEHDKHLSGKHWHLIWTIKRNCINVRKKHKKWKKLIIVCLVLNFL